MTAVEKMLDDESRARLAAWYAGLQALDHLVRERQGCRPPDPAPTLAGLAASAGGAP